MTLSDNDRQKAFEGAMAIISYYETSGSNREDTRYLVVNEVSRQSKQAEIILANEIIKSPLAGMNFVHSVQFTIGIVNEALIAKEYDPIHINELKLVTVETAIGYFDQDIDTLYQGYLEGTLFQ